MPITLQVGGVEYTNFISATASVALDTLANDFSLQAVLPAGGSFPIPLGSACTVQVDGRRVVTGYVESITGNYDANSHVVVLTGRDRTADLLDSSIGVLDDIRAPITLKSIIEKVVAHIGSDLLVIDEATPEPFNEAEDLVKSEPGENAFQFVEAYAQKRQVILTSNADGNVVITNSSTVSSGAVLQNSTTSAGNNIVSAQWSALAGDLFNKYILKAQLDVVALDLSGASSDAGLVSQQGIATDKDVRAGRQMVTVDDKGFSNDQLKSRAEWSKKIRQSRSLLYNCTVSGFTNSVGDVWDVNKLVTVVDAYADVDRDLLLNSITYVFDAQGSVSHLAFVPANAYKILLNEPVPVGSNQSTFKL